MTEETTYLAVITTDGQRHVFANASILGLVDGVLMIDTTGPGKSFGGVTIAAGQTETFRIDDVAEIHSNTDLDGDFQSDATDAAICEGIIAVTFE